MTRNYSGCKFDHFCAFKEFILNALFLKFYTKKIKIPDNLIFENF